ncbi:MAG: hypothetical protein LBU87_07275, partial [Lactobacillales bacterium]|nr:hypothetical protein [Lactobacillales bacterium]
TETGTQSETETDTGTETGTETESDTGTNPCGEGRFYIDGQCLDCDYVSDPKINSSEEQNACLSCGNRTIYSNAIYGSTCALAQCPANHCRIYNGQDGTCMPIGSGLCQEESGSGTDTDTDTDTGSDTGSY